MPVMYINDWPQFSPPDLNRRKCVLEAAKLMVNAAMTAPNAGGVPQIEAELVWGMDELEKTARVMEEMAFEIKENMHLSRMYKYEAQMVRESDVLIFLGNFRAAETPMDAGCGGCGGVEDCSFVYERRENNYGLIDWTHRRTDIPCDGPLCTVRVDDFGYAVGSALWMANRLMVDARAFFTLGAAGRRMGRCPNSPIVVGIMVSALAKNPYVDINTDYHLVNLSKLLDSIRRTYILLRQTGGDYRKSDPGTEREREMRKNKNNKEED